MHRFGEFNEAEEEVRSVRQDRGTSREQAEACAYRHQDGTLFVPGTWFSRAMIGAGSYYKQRGSRKSLMYLVPAAVFVMTDAITLTDNEGHQVKDFEVDARPVTIPATKGRIMRFRPKIEIWHARIPMEIDTDIIPVEQAHQLLEDAGRRQGVGDFRPEKRGPFGRFMITGWDF
jgi:hypothetical protein